MDVGSLLQSRPQKQLTPRRARQPPLLEQERLQRQIEPQIQAQGPDSAPMVTFRWDPPPWFDLQPIPLDLRSVALRLSQCDRLQQHKQDSYREASDFLHVPNR